MFRFENIAFLWAITIIVPVIFLLFIINEKWRNKSLKKIGGITTAKRLMPNVSNSLRKIKFILYTLSSVFLLLAMANLQYGTSVKEVKREGIDIMLALDVSNSMLAEDLSPNRLERAKRAIEKLIEELHNDRLGIVVFAGESYVQLPITTDYSSAKLFLESIGTDIVSSQGTAIGSAIDLCMQSFDLENGVSKAIIVITDGENHEDDALIAAQNAADNNINVFTIGMGSTNGSPIPIYKNGKQIGFRTDKENNTVVTKLNEEMLKQIASEGNGVYVRATNANAGLNIVMNEIDKMEKVEFDSKVYKDYEDRFQFFLIISLLLILVDTFLSTRKSVKFNKIDLFKTK